MTVEVTLTDLSGLIEYTFADIDLQFYAGGGAIFEFADYLDQNYLTGQAAMVQPSPIPEGAMRLVYYSAATGSVTGDFYGDWPAPLSMAELDQNISWVESTANLKIEEAHILAPSQYRILIDFNGEGPTVKEFIETWTEQDLVALNPLVNGEFAVEGGWEGTSGRDRYLGTTEDDIIEGLGGRDFLKGGKGNDEIFGGSGNDKLFGQAGKDTIEGGAGKDKLVGGGGHDVLRGEAGNDRLIGGGGNDSMVGGDGRDVLSGGGGKDNVQGGEGNDRISGGGGNDSLSGSYGNDTLIDGRGDDYMWGGTGADLFIFKKGVAGGTDLVSMERFGGDKIRLEGYGIDIDTSTATAAEIKAAMAAQNIHVVQDTVSWNIGIGFEDTGDAITLTFDQNVLLSQVWGYFEFV